MLMRAPAGMTSLHSGHEKVDEASGRTVSTQRAHSSWLPSQGMILGSRSSSSKGSRHTGHSRALMTVRSRVRTCREYAFFSWCIFPNCLHANLLTQPDLPPTPESHNIHTRVNQDFAISRRISTNLARFVRRYSVCGDLWLVPRRRAGRRGIAR